MVGWVYVLTLASGAATTNATVGHNSSLSMDIMRRILYQDPSNRIVEIELVHDREAEFADFKYHESPQEGRDPLTAAPNTRIQSDSFQTEKNDRSSVYYLQTNGSNIVEYRFDDDSYTVYSTRVVYAG